MKDCNAKTIAEFRANEGRVGGAFEGAPLTLLHHRGRKTGREYVTPMMYLADDGETWLKPSRGNVSRDRHHCWVDAHHAVSRHGTRSEARGEDPRGFLDDAIADRVVDRQRDARR
jgi:hypothetical protein